MFIDTANIFVRAGSGGNGVVSFRHEIYVDRGGPDGGDGGNGGDIILVGDRNVNTLLNFRHKQRFSASGGDDGSKRKRHGKNGQDLIIKVPVGTVIKSENNEIIADITEDGQESIVARGGRGGYGNAHFVSSTRQAPKIAELGEDGEDLSIFLELKLLADVGLVGLPNAGKSTFLSVVSKAKPEIADYPFTTLTPHLGVASVDDGTILIADIPGLIEGASEGKGLGDKFLRHVERTAILLHLIDSWSENILEDYNVIRQELTRYSEDLASRDSVVVLTKIDGVSDDVLATKILDLKNHINDEQTTVMVISSTAHKNIVELLRVLRSKVSQAHEMATDSVEKVVDESSIPVIELPASKISKAWKVQVVGGKFIVEGDKIEGFARRTNFESNAGVDRLRDIMHKMGIMHELERQGITSGDKILIKGAKSGVIY